MHPTDSSSLIGHLHRIKPAEVCKLGAESRGDASNARGRLSWEARAKVRDLVRVMLGHDLADAGIVPGEHPSVP